MILKRNLEFRDALFVIGIDPFQQLVLDAEDIDMPDATSDRSRCPARGSGIENCRFRLALNPVGLTAETGDRGR